MGQAITDTGPLVAFLDRRERHHAWVTSRIEQLAAPLPVCEPALAEAMFLLSRYPTARSAIFELLQNGASISRSVWRMIWMRCRSCIRSAMIGPCLWQTPASFGWPSCTKIIRFSRWTLTSPFTGSTVVIHSALSSRTEFGEAAGHGGFLMTSVEPGPRT